MFKVKQKKILVFINCGWEQFPTVELALKKKYVLYAISFETNYFYKKYFKKVLYCAANEETKIFDFVNKIKPHGIISDQCDFSYMVQSKIAQKFKLKGPDLTQAKIFTNKLLQRKLISKSILKSPAFFSIKKFSQLNKKKLDKIKTKKIVIKPSDNRGGIGIKILQKSEFNEKNFTDALEYSQNKTIIVEEFIEGEHYNLDGLIINNKAFLVGISHNKKMKNMIVNKSLYYDVAFLKKKNISNYFKKLCEIFKPTFGFIHGEIIINKHNDIYLTEIANRGGGIRISNTVLEQISKWDMNDYIIQNSLYNKFNLSKKNKKTNNVLIKFLPIRTKVDKIKVDEKNIIFYKKLSNSKNITNGTERNFMVIAKGENIKDINRNIKKFINNKVLCI